MLASSSEGMRRQWSINCSCRSRIKLEIGLVSSSHIVSCW